MKRVLVLLGCGLALAALIAFFSSDPLGETSPNARADGGDSELRAEDVIAAPSREPREGSERVSMVDPTPEEASFEPTHRLVGRVMDDRRVPAPKTIVSFSEPGHRDFEAETAADGSFVLSVAIEATSARIESSVRAFGASGSAFHQLSLIAIDGTVREIDIGTLVLVPSHALRIEVTDEARPVPNATVEISVTHERLFLLQDTTDANGVLELEDLPTGPLHVSATAQGQSARKRVFVPEETEVTLILEPLKTVEIEIVNQKTGLGIAGAVLTLSEEYHVPARLPSDPTRSMSNEYVSSSRLPTGDLLSDAEGIIQVQGLRREGRYRVSIEAPGYVAFPRRGNYSAARLRLDDSRVRYELTPYEFRTVTWPVIGGDVPVPSDGAEIQLRYRAGSYGRGQEPPLPQPGRMQGSTLVVEAVAGNASFIAEAPDGALAKLWAKSDETLGMETSFRRPRTISVTVRDADGAPVEGARIGANNQGNNPLCEPVPTDAEGEAVLEGLYGGLAQVQYIRPGSHSKYGRDIGTIDLEAGDGKLEFTLEAPPETGRARLLVTIDGSAKLPGRYRLSGPRGTEVVEEDPVHGELKIEFPRSDSETLPVRLQAPGFATATASLNLDIEEPTATLELTRTATLIAYVQEPPDDYVSVFPNGSTRSGERGRPRETSTCARSTGRTVPVGASSSADWSLVGGASWTNAPTLPRKQSSSRLPIARSRSSWTSPRWNG